ncbi:MAG: nucleotide exchange factor GrpE [bacterium]|nr:nucleotide exchange factor GrpE [bacterium]MDZ4231521.1 nucleotide exchange factor GrpE [Patescibacteria group bacterium]
MPKDKSQKNETDKLKEERDEYLDGWKRAKADLANYKKDELKRLEEIVRFAGEDIIRNLLSILDSFELALSAMERDGKVEKGVYLIKSQLEDLLRRRGLERMEVAEGVRFDPGIHDAVTTVPGEKIQDDLIAEEVEAGYILNGKVLRPARVKVYKFKDK